MEQIIGAKVELVGLDKNLKTYTQLTKEIKKQQKFLRDNFVVGSKGYDEQAKKVAELQAEQALLNKEIREQKKSFQQAKEGIGAYKALSKQLGEARARYKDFAAANEESSEEAQELLKTIEELDGRLKQIDKTVGQSFRNVGNYPEAFEASSNSVKGFDRSLKVLGKNPIILVIGVLVGLLGALKQAFQKSKNGAELLARANGVLQAAFGILTKAADKVAGMLLKLFTEPRKELKKFGKALQKEIIERFTAFTGALRNVGEAIRNVLNRDFKAANESIKSAGKNIQTAYGIDDAIKGVKALGKEIKETTDEVKQQAKAFADLASRKRANIRTNIALTKSIEQITTEEEKYQAAADDTTSSFKEQEKAAVRALELAQQRGKLQIQVAQNNLRLVRDEIALRQRQGEDVSALLEQELAATQAVMGATRELFNIERSIERQRRQLRQDRLEKDLDYLIDGFDSQKTFNERSLNNDKLTLQQKAQIVQETAELSNKAFREQVAVIEELAGKQININELLNESDAKRLLEKVRALGLSEIGETRLLEIIRERRTVLMDLADMEKKLEEEREERYQKMLDESIEASFDEVDAVIEQVEKEVDAVIEQVKKEVDAVIDGEQSKQNALIKTKEVEQATSEARLSMLSAFVKGASQLLSQDEEKRKRYAGLLKALAIAEIAINLQRQLQNIALAASQDIAKTGLLGAAFATPAAVAMSIKAIVEAGLATASVLAQQFADGGRVLPYYSGEVVGSSNIPLQPNGDSVLATLKPNEVVLNEQQQAMLGGAATFAAIGVKGFASQSVSSLPSIGTGGNQNLMLKLIKATNNRIDNIKVLADPQDIIQAYIESQETIKTQSL